MDVEVSETLQIARIFEKKKKIKIIIIKNQ